jgi:hypothetical protein
MHVGALTSEDDEVSVCLSVPAQAPRSLTECVCVCSQVFEAIMEGILRYNFAPTPLTLKVNAEDQGVWMNVSHEANAAIDRLAGLRMIDRIKASAGVG